jgi:hypothetical protein
MKNLFKLSSLLFVGLVFIQVACSSDDPPPEVDPFVGKWQMTAATFNSTNVDPTDVMTIENFPTSSGPITLEVPSGASILELTIGAMADGVCADPANYGTFFLELTADGKLILNCASVSVSEETGSWLKDEDPTAGTIITLVVITDAGNLPITFTNIVMTGTGDSFSGQTDAFPMTQVFGEDLALGTNLQFLNTNMSFLRVN